MRGPIDDGHDAIVIGSGFGGVLAAHQLVRSGYRVALLERGDWVERDRKGRFTGTFGTLTPAYSTESSYRVIAGGEAARVGAFHCVGGPSVFYGGVSLRFRAQDFESHPEIVEASGAEWPFSYDDLEPWYGEAESVIGVAGEVAEDPTEAYHTTRYPQWPGALSPTSRRIAQAARRLGLHPFRLPLAFNHRREAGRVPCVSCPRCDGFACPVSAKNDLATAVLPALLRNGLELRTNMVALNLVRAGRSIVAVDCVDRLTGEPRRFAGRQFVLAAGALASPHLLLSSGLDTLNPAGDLVGRFLMRHFNAVVMGVFPKRPEAELQFHKQIGIHDFYFGHPSVDRPLSRLGGIQQVGTPPADLVGHYLPPGVGRAVAGLLPHATGLLVIAEDQPRAENRVTVEKLVRDRYGLPELQICHRYSERDVFAGQVLIQKAKEILHEAGAVATYVQPIRTFSHAVGTARMGVDPRTSPLDAFGLFRGLDNLHLSDASCFPTSAAVNPSLTIAANALRVGNRVAGQLGRGDFVSLGRSA